MRWYTGDPNESVLHDPDLQHAIVQSLKLASLTVLVAVPLGRGLRAGAAPLARARVGHVELPDDASRSSRPELILAVSLFLLSSNTFRFIGLGTTRSSSGLWCWRWPTR